MPDALEHAMPMALAITSADASATTALATAAAIKAVRIGLGARAVEQNGEIAPGDTMTAQYSIPFCVAACLTGDIRDPRTFDAQGLRDPAVAGMIPRIALYTDPEMEAVFPGKFAARVEIETIDGRRFTETLMDAHGTPGDPCEEAEITDKFRLMCASVLDENAIDETLRAIAGLRGAGGVNALSLALRRAKAG